MEIFKEYENEIADINKITKGIMNYFIQMHKRSEKTFKIMNTRRMKMKWLRMN